LAKHWPSIPIFEDITTLTDPPPVDMLAGGFPCQDVSAAGRREGINGSRSGLWSEFHRLIREIRPRYVFVENVPGLLVRGMDRVLGDLSTIGYDAEWRIVSAADVGAPHLRKRVWIVAYPCGIPQGEQVGVSRGSLSAISCRDGREEPVAHDDGIGCDGTPSPWIHDHRSRRHDPQRCSRSVSHPEPAGLEGDECQELEGAGDGRPDADPAGPGWWATEPDVCGMADEFPQGLDRSFPTPDCQTHRDGTKMRKAAHGRHAVSLNHYIEGQGHVSDRMGADFSEEGIPKAPLRALWEHIAHRAASQGRGSDEQLTRELADAMPELPYQRALANREEAVAEAVSFLHNLRKACEEIGVVRDASESLAAAWVAASEEDQDWIYLATCRGQWVSEWPSVPRVATGVPARVDRLKCLGNAVVPQCAEAIGRMILSGELSDPEVY
jgi:site-specific DNA-cytosine methylase